MNAKSFAIQVTQKTRPKDVSVSRTEAALKGDEEDDELPDPPKAYQDAGKGRLQVGRRVRFVESSHQLKSFLKRRHRKNLRHKRN
eukprot:3444772-Prorocentrum_lima.AAC.1